MDTGYIPFAERIGGDAGALGSIGSAAVDASFLTGTGDTDTSERGNIGDDSGERFDPAIHISPDKRNADGSYRRKRNRGAGASSPNKRGPKADSSASIESLTRILAIVHVGIASATKCPEIALQDDEAKALSAATADVLKQFDIRPDPKIEAVIGLCMVAGGIYAPRVYLIRERLKEEKASREQ